MASTAFLHGTLLAFLIYFSRSPRIRTSLTQTVKIQSVPLASCRCVLAPYLSNRQVYHVLYEEFHAPLNQILSRNTDLVDCRSWTEPKLVGFSVPTTFRMRWKSKAFLDQFLPALSLSHLGARNYNLMTHDWLSKSISNCICPPRDHQNDDLWAKPPIRRVLRPLESKRNSIFGHLIYDGARHTSLVVSLIESCFNR